MVTQSEIMKSFHRQLQCILNYKRTKQQNISINLQTNTTADRIFDSQPQPEEEPPPHPHPATPSQGGLMYAQGPHVMYEKIFLVLLFVNNEIYR